MTKTTLINPILRKDALVNARSPKMIIVVTMINCLFAIIASVAFAMSFGSGYQAYYSYIVKLFPILGGMRAGYNMHGPACDDSYIDSGRA